MSRADESSLPADGLGVSPGHRAVRARAERWSLDQVASDEWPKPPTADDEADRCCVLEELIGVDLRFEERLSLRVPAHP
jgi:hypothetical protein